PIKLPPLRERPEDLADLVHHFIQKACAQLKMDPMPSLHPDAMGPLRNYSWPGNVRELENLIKRAVILAKNGKIRPETFLPREPGGYLAAPPPRGDWEALIDERIQAALAAHLPGIKTATPALAQAKPDNAHTIPPLDQTIRENIQSALAQCRGRVHGPKGAAALLGINPSTLRHKLRRLDIDPKAWKNARTALPKPPSETE
ncbi:MAG: hypothetical protein MI747_12925, partial [Desulfobacterales bacterium]|nr:hypothetical protein [Desulfobacterales bacterium]